MIYLWSLHIKCMPHKICSQQFLCSNYAIALSMSTRHLWSVLLWKVYLEWAHRLVGEWEIEYYIIQDFENITWEIISCMRCNNLAWQYLKNIASFMHLDQVQIAWIMHSKYVTFLGLIVPCLYAVNSSHYDWVMRHHN